MFEPKPMLQPLSQIEMQHYQNQMQQAIQQDLAVKSAILQGRCIHELGKASKDCKYCKRIVEVV